MSEEIENSETQYPNLDELETYLDSPEMEADKKALNNAKTAKTQLENLGVPVPAELQEKINELKAKNPIAQLPEWAKSSEWIKDLESNVDKLEGVVNTLDGMNKGHSAESFKLQIAKHKEQLETPKDEFGGVSRAEYARRAMKVLGLKDENEQAERILTPEQAEQLMQTLQTRFESNKERHKNLEWSKIKSSLEAKPEALWSLSEMESAGHDPDVYFADDKGFDVGTCSKESPEQHRNIVYDAEARKGNDDLRSAVEIVEAMGIDLMNEIQYKNQLQANGKYDLDSWSWLKTDPDTRKDGVARGGRRNDGSVYLNRIYANVHDGNGAFRGSLRVLWF